MASSTVDIDIGTRLAVDRTRLAYELTLDGVGAHGRVDDHDRAHGISWPSDSMR